MRFVRLCVVFGLLGCQGDPVGTVPADAGAQDSGFDGGGYKWELVWQDPSAGADDALHAIWGKQDYLVAVGANGATVEFEGTAWDPRVKTAGAHLYGVWGSSKTDVAAVGLYSYDGKPAIFYKMGDMWTVGGPFPPDMPILTSVWGMDTQKYFTALDGRIYQDDPVKWPNKRYNLAVITGGCPEGNPKNPQLNGIDGTNLENIIAVGDDGTIAHRDATGWSRFCSLSPELHHSSVTAIPGSADFYVGSNFHGMYRWLGRTEPLVQIHEDRSFAGADKAYLHGIHAVSSALVIGVGTGGKVLLYDGGNEGARAIAAPTSEDLYDVWALNERVWYIVGAGAKIWRLTLP